MRLGVFGGTFDPPHLGHLILAMECRWQLQLARVLWVLTPTPPHKNDYPITPLDQRLELVQAAIQSDPGFKLSTVDIDRPPPHYAADTLFLLQKQYPGAELVYLMGGDSLNDLPDWHTPQVFVERAAEIGVMRRPGEAHDLSAVENSIPGLSAKVRFVEAPLLEISSSKIRARLAAGAPYRYYLPESVYALIASQNLYLRSPQ
ncbi:MAG: nicotinate-nucleotide adenylyltransferase [Anaerolineales bacterium]|jgi:nicotinate-nucleotide adenylyltransferase